MFGKIKSFKKRAFTLLEVLIAFLIIVIAAVPLLSPYPFIFRAERLMITEMELDQFASQLYVDLLVKVLKKEIDPSSYTEKVTQSVDKAIPFPYTASYEFDSGSVNIVFVPKSKGDTLSFRYVLPKVPSEN